MKKHIPNTLTLLNLLSGATGIIFAFEDQLILSAMMIWIGGVFDFLDGFVARSLKVKSDIGKELDSLADIVTFGLLPSFIVFYHFQLESSSDFLPFVAFLITICAALRLARFNIDDRQTQSFVGLPTPASAIVVSSLPFYAESPSYSSLINVYSLVVLCLVLSFLMVSEIRLFSLKLSGIRWETDKWKIVFILLSLVVLFAFQVLGIPLIIIGYIFFSYFDNKSNTKKVD